jgi:uncharacterized metal-binding protein YceD (DUF177 family)
MDDVFNIYIEQLREGREERFQLNLSPSFIDIQEDTLRFDKPVKLEGSAYLAEQELILHWDVQTEALIHCSICNEPVAVSLHIPNFYYSEPVSEIKTGIYNFKDLLRETILLETPSFAECCNGNCPKRVEYQKYLKETSDHPPEDEGYQPFAGLEEGIWKP